MAQISTQQNHSLWTFGQLHWTSWRFKTSITLLCLNKENEATISTQTVKLTLLIIVIPVFRSPHQRPPIEHQRQKFWWPSVPTPLHCPLKPRIATANHICWTSETTPLSSQWRSLWEHPCSSSTSWLLLLFTTRRISADMTSTGAAVPSEALPMTWLTPRRRRSCPCRWSNIQNLTGG